MVLNCTMAVLGGTMVVLCLHWQLYFRQHFLHCHFLEMLLLTDLLGAYNCFQVTSCGNVKDSLCKIDK